MSNLKTYTTKANYLKTASFYPRNYDPVYLFVKDNLKNYFELKDYLIDEVKGGSTPPYYLFFNEYEDNVIPFVKTSAISRDLININDLHFIHPEFHRKKIKRSITKPYDIIYSMTGKFMGKAALCPNTINELNMSQNSVVLQTKSPLHSAFITIFLNSEINRKQIFGLYSITKQKYLNQGKIAKLRILDLKRSYEKDLLDYLEGITNYYDSISTIKMNISEFNNIFKLPADTFHKKTSFMTKPDIIDTKILTAQYYRNDVNVSSFINEGDKQLIKLDIKKGTEIGSKNYLFEGIPFIKTSNFLNYSVDYQPNYYCSDAIYNELEQDLHTGDLLFTKDGKIGEVSILEESAKIVISSGIVRVRPQNDNQRYFLFLLLSSDFGKIYFNKWTVIASTMAHLRKDFYKDFRFINFDNEYIDNLITKTKKAFHDRKEAYFKIELAKKRILSQLYSIIDIH